MMAPADPTNNNGNDSSEVPKSPNPSTTSSDKSRKENNSSVEDDAKWRQLMDNHHQQCDFQKCKGKRTNGLYMCQFSNIPGSVYSQYLRHCRRLNAYKTKPCRNFFGNGFCKARENCSFYHSLEEKKLPPELDFDGLMDGSASMMGDGIMGYWNGGGDYLLGGGSGCPGTPILQQQFFPNHLQQQQQQSAINANELSKVIETLFVQIRPIQQKLTKHICETSAYFRSMSTMPTSNENNSAAAKQQRSSSFSRAVGDKIKQHQQQMMADGSGRVGHHDFDFDRSFHLFNESYPLKNLPTDFSAATCSSASATTIGTNDENNVEEGDISKEDPPTPLAVDKFHRA